jgi:putative hydrolase
MFWNGDAEMKYVLDSHAHTLASGHAYNTINEMAAAAAEKGLELLALTEHAMMMPGTCHEFYFMNLKVLPRQMFGIEVLFGSEVNIMDYDGRVDMQQGLLEKMDVVVASMHTPCIEPGTEAENTRAYLKAMENPAVNIIGHPDDGRYPVDFQELVLAAKEHHVLLELNNSSLRPGGSRKDPIPNDRKMLELCCRYEVPIIVNSDSHCAADVGSHQYAKQLLAEMQFPEHLIVNRSVEEYKKYINHFTAIK